MIFLLSEFNRIIVFSDQSQSIRLLFGYHNRISVQWICKPKSFLKKLVKKFKKCIGLDPAGSFFSDGNGLGRCQGIKSDVAEYTMTIHTNPGGIDTDKFDLAMVNVFSNKNELFCQHDVLLCNLIGTHFYATDPIFTSLVNKVTLIAAMNQTMRNVLFYENIWKMSLIISKQKIIKHFSMPTEHMKIV